MLESLSLLQKLELGTTGLNLASGLLGSVGDYRNATMVARTKELQARENEIAAQTARLRGAQEYQVSLEDTARTISSNRAALAANGIVVGQDTALDFLVQTAGVGATDAIMALNNAEQDAIRYLNEANTLRAEAANKRTEGFMAGVGGAASEIATAGKSAATILAGGSNVEPKFNIKWNSERWQ